MSMKAFGRARALLLVSWTAAEASVGFRGTESVARQSRFGSRTGVVGSNFMKLRGGGDSSLHTSAIHPAAGGSSSAAPSYETRAFPAPGSPFHYAFPVHDLELAKDFYSNVLGCEEGRSSTKWQDFSLHGHQIVCHWVGSDYRCQDYYNPVDGDEVPVPHVGLALTVDEFHALAQRLEEKGIQFIIKPHLRFQGMPGEQYTMFFKDPSGNNLEFKAMTKPENLFAKYNVVDSDSSITK